MTDIVPSGKSPLATDDWYKLDETGLDIIRIPTWEEAVLTGEKLARLHGSLPMVIGDFINAVEGTFGEKYELVLEMFGEWEYSTVANYASVMRKVPKERRLPGLTYSHYKALTNLTPQEQIEAQKVGLEERMSSGEFWKYVKGTALDFAGLCDKYARAIAEMYSQTTSIDQDEALDEARRQLGIAAADWHNRKGAQLPLTQRENDYEMSSGQTRAEGW